MSNFNKKFLPKQEDKNYYSCLACNKLFYSSHYCINSGISINYKSREKYLVIGTSLDDYIKVTCEQEEVQNKINSYIRNLLFK